MTTAQTDPFAAESSSGGGTSISWKDAPVGKTITGVITEEPKLIQGKEYGTGLPAVWPDGNPKMVIPVNLRVGEEDMTLWVPYKSNLFWAINAVSSAAGKPLAIGGTLAVKYTGMAKNKPDSTFESRQFVAKYDPPAAADPFGDVPPAVQAIAAPAAAKTESGWSETPPF